MKARLTSFRGDLLGGLMSAAVAIPLALSLGEATGAGALAGLWGTALVALVAALVGGAPGQISGPTAPTILVFIGLYGQLCDPVLAFSCVMLAGLFLILFGLLNWEQYARLVPYPVLSGLMSGIGIVIVVLQLDKLLGHRPNGGTLGVLRDLPSDLAAPVWPALACGATALAVSYLWRGRPARWRPAPIAALLAGIAVSFLIPGAPRLGAPDSVLPDWTLPAMRADTAFLMIQGALVLAVLATLDTMLSALAADRVTRRRHNPRRELIGQGLANLTAGLAGGIPGAGTTARTVLNIRLGGRTRLAGILCGAVLIGLTLGLGRFVSLVPHAVLAGIIVKLGLDLVDWRFLARLRRVPPAETGVTLLVLVLTITVDLVTALALGVVLAALLFAKKMADMQLEQMRTIAPRAEGSEEERMLAESCGRITLFDFGGPLSFGAAAELTTRVALADRARALILDFSRVPFIDASAAMAVETAACSAAERGCVVYITGVSDKVAEVLEGLAADRCLPPVQRYRTRLEAIRQAVGELEGQKAAE